MKERRLLVWAALFLALGVACGKAFPLPLFVTGGSALFCAAASFLCYRLRGVRAAFLCALSALVFAGMLRMELSETVWRQQSHGMIGTEGVFTVVISGEGKRGAGYARFPVMLVSVKFPDGEERALRGDAYLYVPEAERLYLPDERLSVSGELSGIRFLKNPGKPDWESRYRDETRIGRLYAGSAGEVKELGRAGEFPLARISYEVRETLRARFAPYLDPVRLPLLMTLLFGGNYEELPDGILEAFTATGIVHILSVSGSHMALLFGFLILLGTWLHLPRRAVMVASLFAMVCYAALAGFVPPVVRAMLMGALAVLALLFKREKEGILLLSAAVFVMLLWDPYYLFDISFELSVLASAGLLLFYRPLSAWLLHILPEKLSEGIAMAVAAQILTVPLVLCNFHRLPVYFIPTNIFVAPFLETVIIVGLAAAPLVFLLTPPAAGLLFVADYMLWAAMRIDVWLAQLPYSSLYLGAMSLEWAILYYAAAVLVATGWHRRQVWQRAWLLAAVVTAAWGLYRMPERIFFVPDLGSSRGAVLSSPAGTILYYKDGGAPVDAAGRELVSVLGYYGIFSVDLLLLDVSDCVTDSPFQLALPVQEVWVADKNAKRAGTFAASHPEANIRRLSKGMETLADGTVVTVGGKDMALESAGDVFYLDGGEKKALSTRGEHVFWIGGGSPFLSGVISDKIQTISPHFFVYTGGRGEAAGEDRDFFSLHDWEAADVETDGLASFARVRGEWVSEWR